MAEYISRETAFVQPAVHCKDCKYAQNPNDTMVYCTYFECGTMSQNDFCSQGELRMAEYISREEAIKNLREVYEHECPMASGDFDEYASHDMPNVLRNMKAADVQPVNQWISVEDRLPDATYDCLVWYSCDTAFGKCKSWGIAHCSRCDWYTKHLDGDNIVVLYWMPLPEPPKDGEHND